MELRNIFYINCVSFPGVTDFKAVKDSSRSEAPAAGLSLVVVAASVGAVCLLSVTTLCIVFTYRRKVGTFFSTCIFWLVVLMKNVRTTQSCKLHPLLASSLQPAACTLRGGMM